MMAEVVAKAQEKTIALILNMLCSSGPSIVNGNSISACGVEKRQWRELESQEQADERIQKYSGGNP